MKKTAYTHYAITLNSSVWTGNGMGYWAIRNIFWNKHQWEHINHLKKKKNVRMVTAMHFVTKIAIAMLQQLILAFNLHTRCISSFTNICSGENINGHGKVGLFLTQSSSNINQCCTHIHTVAAAATAVEAPSTTSQHSTMELIISFAVSRMFLIHLIKYSDY